MKNFGTALRLLTLVALVFGALVTGAPQPAQAQMGCGKYCRTVCIATGEACCFITENTCGCC